MPRAGHRIMFEAQARATRCAVALSGDGLGPLEVAEAVRVALRAQQLCYRYG